MSSLYGRLISSFAIDSKWNTNFDNSLFCSSISEKRVTFISFILERFMRIKSTIFLNSLSSYASALSYYSTNDFPKPSLRLAKDLITAYMETLFYLRTDLASFKVST